MSINLARYGEVGMQKCQGLMKKETPKFNPFVS
jgi:hypothetical protein